MLSSLQHCHSLVLFPPSRAPPNRLNVTIDKITSVLRKDDDNKEETALPAVGLQRERMPKHVALVTDGNRRWAEKEGLPRLQGYEIGARTLRDVALLCFKWGIPTVTAFAFSTENWGRAEDEVNELLELIERFIELQRPMLLSEGIKFNIIGELDRVPKSLLRLKLETEEATKSFRKELIVAAGYGGRYDILQACKSIAQKAKDGVIQVEDVNENLMEQELLTKCTTLPHPDLMIRTGEQRLSNFYLWQLAYTELYFPPILWPDFDEAALTKALTLYQQRDRRFGRRDS